MDELACSLDTDHICEENGRTVRKSDGRLFYGWEIGGDPDSWRQYAYDGIWNVSASVYLEDGAGRQDRDAQERIREREGKGTS